MLLQLRLRRRVLATVRGALLRGFRMSGQDAGWTLARGAPRTGQGHVDLASPGLLAPLSLPEV